MKSTPGAPARKVPVAIEHMPSPTPSLRALIAAELPSLVALRREFHQHPELSLQEQQTSQVVRRELERAGVAFKAGLAGGTGIVAHLPASTGEQRPAVALRADMDALPIEEQTGVAYASCRPGVMHACGHDGHMAILLGAARVLSRVHRPNPVTLIFQPAEEHFGGADLLCAQGVLRGESDGGIGSPVGRVFGLHGWPQLPLGQVASRPGPLMAAVDDFTITVRGVQCHAAYPHLGRDPILASAHVVTALQSIASRNVGPLEAVVVSVGQIQGGTANNIIPETVTLVGTVRTLRDDVRAMAGERFHEVVRQTAQALGCSAQIDYVRGYPVVVNDADAFAQVERAAGQALVPRQFVTLDQPTMGGEDFSYYARHVPACFFFLGLRPAGVGEYPLLHQPTFNFNDDAIPPGVEMFVRLATRE